MKGSALPSVESACAGTFHQSVCQSKCLGHQSVQPTKVQAQAKQITCRKACTHSLANCRVRVGVPKQIHRAK